VKSSVAEVADQVLRFLVTWLLRGLEEHAAALDQLPGVFSFVVLYVDVNEHVDHVGRQDVGGPRVGRAFTQLEGLADKETDPLLCFRQISKSRQAGCLVQTGDDLAVEGLLLEEALTP
jgi:hypothetical protein